MTEEDVLHWLEDGGSDNPAGPLFSSEFSEADLAAVMQPTTIGGHPCSACTASYPGQCC